MQEPWIILLIGGHSGVGKSLVARQLANEWQIPLTQADDVRMILQRFIKAEETPDLHYFQNPEIIREATIETMVQKLIGIGRTVSTALEVVIAHAALRQRKLILEGDGITPELAAQQWYDGVQVENGVVRAVFLVEDQLDMLWSKPWSDKGDVDFAALNEQRRWAEVSWQYGQWLKREAQQQKLPVLPSQPWQTLAERIKAIL